MKKSELYEIIIKIIGILMLYKTLELFISLIASIWYYHEEPLEAFSFDNSANDTLFVGLSLSIAAHIAIIYFLLFRTKPVLKIIYKEDESDMMNLNFQIDKQTVYQLSLIVIASITLINSLPKLILNLNNLLLAGPSTDPIEEEMEIRILPWEEIIKTLLGTILLTNSNKLSSLSIPKNFEYEA